MEEEKKSLTELEKGMLLGWYAAMFRKIYVQTGGNDILLFMKPDHFGKEGTYFAKYMGTEFGFQLLCERQKEERGSLCIRDLLEEHASELMGYVEIIDEGFDQTVME